MVNSTLPRSVETLAGTQIIVLSTEEGIVIAASKAAAVRDEFATDEEVQAVWAEHGL